MWIILIKDHMRIYKYYDFPTYLLFHESSEFNIIVWKSEHQIDLSNDEKVHRFALKKSDNTSSPDDDGDYYFSNTV